MIARDFNLIGLVAAKYLDELIEPASVESYVTGCVKDLWTGLVAFAALQDDDIAWHSIFQPDALADRQP